MMMMIKCVFNEEIPEHLSAANMKDDKIIKQLIKKYLLCDHPVNSGR